MRKVAESTIRRLSLYLRFLEEFEGQGMATVSSESPDEISSQAIRPILTSA